MAPPTSASDRRPAGVPGNPLRTGGLVLLGIALALSGYLIYASLSSTPAAGCDAGNCGVVLGSKWAKVFGVPVGLFGAGAYLVLLILGLRPFTASQRGARTAAAALALLIPGAALWFLALQMFVIHAFCPWCCATHAIASVGAVLLILAWNRDARRPAAGLTGGRKTARAQTALATAPVWGSAAALAGVGLAGFLGAQVLSPEPPRAKPITATMASAPAPTTPAPVTPTTSSNTGPVQAAVPPGTSTNPASATVQTTASVPTSAAPATSSPAPPTPAPRRIVLHEGRFQIDPHAYPVNGSPTAEHLVVMISDYTCPHCRAAYKILKEVRETFDAGQLSYVMLPSHHGGDSLDLQVSLLTAWRLDPGVWAEVSGDLYLERLPLKPEPVRQILRQRLGADRFDPAVRDLRPWIDTVFTLAREVHAANKARAGSGSIPQFVIGPEIVVGSPADATDLFRLLEKNLGLVRRDFPDLRLTRDGIELGRVFAGTGPTVAIGYSNAGPSKLVISRATVPQGGRALRGLQVPVEPGATGMVDVAVAVPRNPGAFEQIVTLFSNSRTAEHLFTVKGEAWKPIRVDPAFIDLGRVDPDASSPTQAVMRIELDEVARIASVTAQNPGFNATLREVTPGRSYEIVVSPAKTLAAGAQQTTLMVALAKPVPAGWPENLAFAARAVVEAAVSILPQRIVVPSGTLTADRHQQILVRCNDGTIGFALEEASIDGGPPIAIPQISAGARTNEFLVRFTLPAGWMMPPPPIETRINVRTTHPRFPTLSVPIAVQGR